MYYITTATTTPPAPPPQTYEQFLQQLSAGYNPTKTYTRTVTYRKPTCHYSSYRERAARFTNQFSNPVYNILERNQGDMSQEYTSFQIPKRTGGFRTINAPNDELKTLLKDITTSLQRIVSYAHNAAFAYVPERNTKHALEVHQEKENNIWFQKIDLKNFFGSCTKDFIIDSLKVIPFFVALNNDYPVFFNNLIDIAMLDGGLPQGSPLSPWLTNQIMLKWDFEIQQKAYEHNLIYTRYADDMTFSAPSRANVKWAERIVAEVLRDTPLRINAEKTRTGSKYGKNFNLGLMLNKDNKITVGHRKKERFKATLHNLGDLIAQDTLTYQQATEILGTINYYKSIEPEYFTRIIQRYNQKMQLDLEKELKKRL